MSHSPTSSHSTGSPGFGASFMNEKTAAGLGGSNPLVAYGSSSSMTSSALSAVGNASSSSVLPQNALDKSLANGYANWPSVSSSAAATDWYTQMGYNPQYPYSQMPGGDPYNSQVVY